MSNLLTDSASRSRFRGRLLAWYDQNRRELPWRNHNSLYRVWVSEIMLQQTQVATVVRYFRQFIKRFPNVKSLARADLQDVLQIWEGLGYYRRAKQLHAAAAQIMHKHNGRFPMTFEHVVALPGIGKYTAGAILSTACDQPHPILEGNTQRVYSRLMAFKKDPKSSQMQRQLWEFARALVTRHRPGDLNQALMELGSEICTVRLPRCEQCPVRHFCLAFDSGNAESFPVMPAQRIRYEAVREAVVVIQRGQRVLLRQCQPGERWANLWDFPRFTLPEGEHQKFLCRQISESTGLDIKLHRPFTRLKHTVTRFRISLDCYRASDIQGRLKNNGGGGYAQWVAVDQISERPLPITGRKIAQLITSGKGAG